MRYTYQIEGMHCPACVEKIRSALQQAHVTIEAITLQPPLLTIIAEQAPALNVLNDAVVGAGNYHLSSLKTALGFEKEGAADTADTADTAGSAIRSPDALDAPQSYYPLFLIIIYIVGLS